MPHTPNKPRTSQAPILARVLQKIAPRIGARVELEPVWQVAGRVVYKSGRKRYFRFSSVDVNRLGATDIAKDKDYAAFFMVCDGYPVIPGKAFYSDEWAQTIGSSETPDAAVRFVKKDAHDRKVNAYPRIVKPNSQSQGRGVHKVHNEKELRTALRAVFRLDRVALVQDVVMGKDYRLVVLDSEVISAYERMPLSVVGDGRSTILELLTQKQKEFVHSGRDTVIKIDARIRAALRTQNLSLTHVLERGRTVLLLPNANLSQGGDSLDVTQQVHPSIRDMAVRLTRDMGLRLCGVDLMLDGDITQPLSAARSWHIIEINAAPGLDHYAASGAEQQQIVEDLYLKVLERMEE